MKEYSKSRCFLMNLWEMNLLLNNTLTALQGAKLHS